LRAYAYCGGVTKAAKVIKTSHVHHLKWLVKDPEYAAKFEEAAVAYRVRMIELYEKECDKRAIEGWDEPVFYQGLQTGLKRKFSDILLMFRLKKLDPSYRDSQQINVQQNNQTNVHQTQIRVVEDGDWYSNADRLASEAAAESDTDPTVAS